jgi:hypothetical protein
MPPNHAIALIFLLVLIFIFILWRFGKHFAVVIGHHILMTMMEEEARREEDAQATEGVRAAAEATAPAPV